MWRQCLMAGFPAHVRLSPELEGGSSFATRTTLPIFSSQKWSGIINKYTENLNWKRTCILIAVPPYIWSEMPRWWKAYASLCIFCSARELRSAAQLQLSCAQAACVQPGARQLGLKAALDHTGTATHLLHHWPQACIENRPLLQWDQNLSLCYLESSPAIPPVNNSHGSPWLVIALIGSNPSLFKTSVLLRPRLGVFLLKPWFYNLFTCGIPTEMDMDKSALSSCFSGSAWSTTKYRKQIPTEEMVFFFVKRVTTYPHYWCWVRNFLTGAKTISHK